MTSGNARGGARERKSALHGGRILLLLGHVWRNQDCRCDVSARRDCHVLEELLLKGQGAVLSYDVRL